MVIAVIGKERHRAIMFSTLSSNQKCIIIIICISLLTELVIGFDDFQK